MAENTNTERADFEAWAISQKLGEYTAQMGFRYHDAGNLYPAWQAWQARASLSLPAAGQEPVATSASGGDWENPTTVRQRLGDAVQLLCAGKRPDDSMLDSWLKETSEELQSFCASHVPAWCQGIALIDAAMLMVDQPTEITTITHPDRDHEHRAAPQPAAQVAGQEPVAADALATLRGAFAPFAQEPKWTTEHSMKYPSKAAQIINAVRDLLASAPQTGAQEQSEWDIRGQLAAKLTCWHRLTGNEAAELVALAKSWGAPQPAVAAGWPLIARALNEWHEDDGPVMWWAWNGSASGWAGEPAWCGTPLSSDWPGYHTHWTPHPTFPPAPSTEGESRGQ